MANDLLTRGSLWYNNFSFWDADICPQKHTSLMELVPLPMLLYPAIGYNFMDDFHVMESTKAAQADHWTVTEDDGAGGTNAVQEAVNGVYRHYCDGDDNDEAYVHSTNETFALRNGKHLFWEARVKLTESATNKANFIVGLSENVGADHLQDNGAGPPASYDGMCWYKLDSNMFIEFETSLAAAQVESSDVAAHVSGTWYRLGAWCKPNTATTYTVYPFYQVGTNNGVLQTTSHALTLTGHGEMEAFFGVKAGSGAEEYIEIDYFWVCQQR